MARDQPLIKDRCGKALTSTAGGISCPELVAGGAPLARRFLPWPMWICGRNEKKNIYFFSLLF